MVLASAKESENIKNILLSTNEVISINTKNDYKYAK